eukprot:2907114-Ditylum_brightwellii.AAC.1
MGTYASVLKTKLFHPNPQDEEVTIYDVPPDNRKRRAIILNTEKGEKPTASINTATNTRLGEKNQEEENNGTEFKNKLNHEMAEFKRKMQEDFQKSQKA